MTTSLIQDAQARQEALEINSFIVEAPAGAGKTELLTQRFLRLLAVVENPEEVMALTFTNKASTEMRDRILGSLERTAAGIVPAEPHKRQTFDLAQEVLKRDAACHWNLLGHPGRLRITTLDALCANLARQMPYLSRFGSQPPVCAEPDIHYATAAQRTLEMVDQGTSDAEVVAEALSFVDNHAGRLESLLVSMLSRRDQWVHHASRIESGALRPEVEAGFAALIERDLMRVTDFLDAARQVEIMPLARFAAANAPGCFDALKNWTVPLDASINDLPGWRALGEFLLTGSGTIRKTVDKRSGFPAGADNAIQKQAMLELLRSLTGLTGLADALSVVPSLPSPQFDRADWATVECFSRLLRLAAGQLWLVFQEVGEVDFIEIAGRASMALGDEDAPTDLAQALDYRIQHLLVDEFQDTSPSQVSLLEKLTRGWVPGDGRTLFVVGDPMQSIYRFRKADVGLFLRVRDFGIGDIRLQHLRLCRNNRSFPAIVDWVNSTFPTVFPAEDSPEAGAVRYSASVATKPPRTGAGVTVHAVIERPGSDSAGAEAACVLDLIIKTRQQAPTEKIAVLVRARKHLDTLVAEIRHRSPSMRFQAVDIEGLDGRQHVQDLLTLYRALCHRADRVHWLATLRAPWCGLTLADLHALAGDDHSQTIWKLINDEGRVQRLSADGQMRLLHVRAVFQQAFANRDRQSPRRWLEGVWLMLDGPRCLDLPSAMADVTAFLDLMDSLTFEHQLDADQLADRAAKLFAPADPLGDAVQMMTIHKSKGLEFDTVIVLGLDHETGGNDSSLLLWDEVAGPHGRSNLLVAPMRRKGTGKEPIPYDTLRRLENERSAHENERLLYVAATRAIRELHLVGVAKSDLTKFDGLSTPASGSLLALIWPDVAQPVFATAALAVSVDAPQLPANTFTAFVPPLIRLRQPTTPTVLQGQDLAIENDNPPLPLEALEGKQRLEASVGTLVHRVLQQIVVDGQANWPISRVQALQPAWQRWLARQGHALDAIAGSDEAAEAIIRTLNSKVGQWLMADHLQSAAEEAWSSLGQNGTSNHVIDRTFVFENQRWIIDYKTVRLANGVGRDALATRAESFRPQLQRYSNLFQSDALPLRTAIYFPLQDELVEL